MTEPRVAVIVLTHGDYAQRFLADCYSSLMAQTYPKDRFTVFVVNNGAEEPYRRLARALAPKACFLESPVNLGWTGGNNLAIAAALQAGFDQLALVNVDMVLDPSWLEELVAEAVGRPDLHILQSAILLQGSGRINSLGNRIHFLGYGFCNGYGRTAGELRSDEPIDFASGAAMLVKRDVFEAVGLLRDDYFIYCDDLEFCWRARLAGFNVGLAPRSVGHHAYEFSKMTGQLFYLTRNRLTTLLTLARRRTLAVLLPMLLVTEALFSVYCVLRGWGRSRWDVVRHFANPKTWGMIRRHRQHAQRIRRRSDAEIVKGFAGSVVFAELDQPLLRYVVNPLLAAYWAVARRLIVW